MPNWVQNQLIISGDEEAVNECLTFCKSEDSDFDFNKIVPMPETLGISEAGDSVPAAAYVYSLLSEKQQKEVSGVLKTKTTMEAGGFPRIEKTWFEVINDRLKEESDLNKRIASWKPNESDIECGAETFEEYGRIVLNNILNYGYTSWYEWRCNHWGTKWSANEVILNAVTRTQQEVMTNIFFQTAWDCPGPIIRVLSKKFSELIFTLSYADEDMGDNCGRITLINDIEQPGGVCYDYLNWKDNPQLGREAITFACNVWGYDPEEYLDAW